MSTKVPTAAAATAVLRARGFALCKPDAKEKKPTYRGWSARSLEPADFAEGDQIGVMGGALSPGGRPGHSLVLVDLDAADAVACADRHLPATGMSEGRAGKPRSHRYFLVPNDSIPRWALSAAKQAAAAATKACGHPGPFLKHFTHRDTRKGVLDFIGTGGQVVCPPSMHASGERREWAGDSPFSPGEPAVVSFLDIWRAVCELASECGAAVPDVMPRPARPPAARRPESGGGVVKRAVKYLAKAPPAVAGQSGHGRLMWAARVLVYGFGLEPETALDVLRAEYNPTCLPPWSEKELRHKVEDADRIPFDKPRGWLRDADRERAFFDKKAKAAGSGRKKVKPEPPHATPDTPVATAAEPPLPSAASPGSDTSPLSQTAGGTPQPPLPPEGERQFPPPGDGESWNDPNRLARLYVHLRRHTDGEPVVRQWRDEFHVWDGGAFRALPESDLDAEIARHARAVFAHDYPYRLEAHEERKASEKNPGPVPVIYPVTTRVKSDVKLNVSGLVNIPDDGTDAPFWQCDPKGLPPAEDVVAAPNGLFTLDDIAAGRGAFRPPTPLLFTHNSLPFPVQPNPPEPTTWLRCVGEWLDGDAASVRGLQEVMGYLLSARTCAHKVLMLIGQKRSGKGTCIRVLTALVGPRNVASTTFTALGESFGMEDLLGKRVAVIPDARLSGRADVPQVVERLLSISGEDSQSVNRKNKRRVSTFLKARFLLASNLLPALADPSGALASRFFFLHFPNTWLGKEDKGLEDKLRAELPGILMWAAQGYVRLRGQDYTFTPNEAGTAQQQELDDLSSPVRAFVRERCSIGPEHEVRTAELCAAWQNWNEVRRRRGCNDNVFGHDLTAAFPHIVRSQPRIDGVKVRIYKGIGLRPRADWGDPDENVERTGTRSNSTHAWREESSSQGGSSLF